MYFNCLTKQHITTAYQFKDRCQVCKRLHHTKLHQSSHQWRHIQGLNLADPSFVTPSPVDCLIGAEIYPEVIRIGLQSGSVGSPIAQNMIFGWVLIGPIKSPQETTRKGLKSFNTTVAPFGPLGDQIYKLWELEELSNSLALTPAKEECEAHFSSSHKRVDSGRFVV